MRKTLTLLLATLTLAAVAPPLAHADDDDQAPDQVQTLGRSSWG